MKSRSLRQKVGPVFGEITADTNVLVQVSVNDDPRQAQQARHLLREAETIALTLPTLCEFVWVVGRGYRRPAADIVAAIRRLLAVPTVAVDRTAVEAGLSLLEAGGDFADGAIAFEGRRLGGAVFVSFDRDAVQRVAAAGDQALLISESQA